MPMAMTIRRSAALLSAIATIGSLGWLASRAPASANVLATTRGHWGKAIEVPGLKKRNAGGNATVYAISCLSPGNCLAGGHFDPIAGAPYVTEGFLVAQHDGTWRDRSRVTPAGPGFLLWEWRL